MRFIKKIAFLFLISTLQISCGRAFEVMQAEPQGTPSLPTDLGPTSEESYVEPTTGESPKSSPDPQAVAAKNYLIENPSQVFRLNQLGHFLYARFRCQVHFTQPKIAVGTVIISFSASKAKVTWRENNSDTIYHLVSLHQVCDQKTQQKNQNLKGKGYISKNTKKNQYILSYQLDTTDPVFFYMIWDAAQKKPGQLVCQHASMQSQGEFLYKARIDSCILEHQQN